MLKEISGHLLISRVTMPACEPRGVRLGCQGWQGAASAEARPAQVFQAQLLPMHVFELWQHYRCTLGLPCFLANVLQLELSWHKIRSGQVHRCVLRVCAWVQRAASRVTKVHCLQKLKCTIQGLRVKGQTPLEGRRSLTPSPLR